MWAGLYVIILYICSACIIYNHCFFLHSFVFVYTHHISNCNIITIVTIMYYRKRCDYTTNDCLDQYLAMTNCSDFGFCESTCDPFPGTIVATVLPLWPWFAGFPLL